MRLMPGMRFSDAPPANRQGIYQGQGVVVVLLLF